MTIQNLDELSLQPLKRDFQGYNLETFKSDLGAGLVVALLTVPQVLAYSLVAGLPLSCGLLAAIFATAVAALFGSSSQLIVGPNNAISMLVLYATSEILFTHFRGLEGPEREIVAVQILTQLALLVAIMQILAAACKLGRLIQFVSYSVVVGYLAGTSMAVIINQLFTFTGIHNAPGLFSLYEKFLYVLFHLFEIHIPTALVGIGSLFMLLFLKKINSKIPAAVVTLMIAGVTVHLLGLTTYSEEGLFSRYTEGQIGNVTLVGDTGDIQGMLPRFRFPYFSTAIMNHLLPYAFAIALLSILETTAVAKSLVTSTGQRLSINQDILGLALGNLSAAFTGGLLCSGSPTRSSLNYKNGAKTRMAAVCSSAFVAVIVLTLGYFVSRTPLPALSALLLVSAVSVINFKQFFLCLKATQSDAAVIIATLVSCLFFSLNTAFYIGIIISITLYLKKAAMPHLVECAYDEFGRLDSLEASDRQEHKLIRIINVKGELFFAAADLFQSTLKSIAEDDAETKVIILRLKNARDIDATVCLAIQQLNDYLRKSGRYLLACGLTHHTWQVMCNAGLVEEMGKENLFILDEKRPQETLQRALLRAQQLTNTTKKIEPEIVSVPLLNGIKL